MSCNWDCTNSGRGHVFFVRGRASRVLLSRVVLQGPGCPRTLAARAHHLSTFTSFQRGPKCGSSLTIPLRVQSGWERRAQERRRHVYLSRMRTGAFSGGASTRLTRLPDSRASPCEPLSPRRTSYTVPSYFSHKCDEGDP